MPSRQPNAQAPASVGLQGRGNVEVGEKRLALFALSAAVLRKAARTGVLTAVRVRSSAAGRIGVVVSGRVGKRRLRVGRASRRLSKPGVARFRVPLSAAARKQLKAAGVLRLRIVARSSGARQRSVKATLRRTGR